MKSGESGWDRIALAYYIAIYQLWATSSEGDKFWDGVWTELRWETHWDNDVILPATVATKWHDMTPSQRKEEAEALADFMGINVTWILHENEFGDEERNFDDPFALSLTWGWGRRASAISDRGGLEPPQTRRKNITFPTSGHVCNQRQELHAYLGRPVL